MIYSLVASGRIIHAGDTVEISGIKGMTPLNNALYRVETAVPFVSFTLNGIDSRALEEFVLVTPNRAVARRTLRHPFQYGDRITSCTGASGRSVNIG